MSRIVNMLISVQIFIIRIISRLGVGLKQLLKRSPKKELLKIHSPGLNGDFEITNNTLITIPITIYAVNLPIFLGFLDQFGIEFAMTEEMADIVDLVSDERSEHMN